MTSMTTTNTGKTRKARAPKPKPAALTYKRSTAAALRGWSTRTLSRWERTDPSIPERVALGPDGGPPYGYVAVEWDAYCASLPRVARPNSANLGVRVADVHSAIYREENGKEVANTSKRTPKSAQKGTAKAPKVAPADTPTTATA